jgi:redox-sensitive bicupin YhaK (pirin superfamily)
MSNLSTTTEVELCVSEPAAKPAFQVLPGRLTDVGGLPIRRLLPRSQRRTVGPWCFLDSYGPVERSSGKPMDVPPHPHIGLQTVSWLLEGDLHHKDSLGLEGLARPGTLNLMTAGRGIAHAEESSSGGGALLRGVQLWVALPDAARVTAPAFEQHRTLPVVRLEGGEATLIMGELGGARSPARAFSPLVAAEVSSVPSGRLVLPLNSDYEHALVLLGGTCGLDGQALAIDTLYYLGCGRRDLVLSCDDDPARALLLGGAPFGEAILMWWNFVARTNDEIRAAREDWEAGRRFGEVKAYEGRRAKAPPLVDRPIPRPRV